MLATICKIYGVNFKLKYQRTHTEKGELFKGMIFLKNPVCFSFVKRKGAPVSFITECGDHYRENAIVKAIEEAEQRLMTASSEQ